MSLTEHVMRGVCAEYEVTVLILPLSIVLDRIRALGSCRSISRLASKLTHVLSARGLFWRLCMQLSALATPEK